MSFISQWFSSVGNAYEWSTLKLMLCCTLLSDVKHNIKKKYVSVWSKTAGIKLSTRGTEGRSILLGILRLFRYCEYSQHEQYQRTKCSSAVLFIENTLLYSQALQYMGTSVEKTKNASQRNPGNRLISTPPPAGKKALSARHARHTVRIAPKSRISTNDDWYAVSGRPSFSVDLLGVCAIGARTKTYEWAKKYQNSQQINVYIPYVSMYVSGWCRSICILLYACCMMMAWHFALRVLLFSFHLPIPFFLLYGITMYVSYLFVVVLWPQSLHHLSL